MPRPIAALLCLLLASPALAQDMPLSQVLIDGEGWKEVAKDCKCRYMTANRKGEVFLNRFFRIDRLDANGKLVPFVTLKTITDAICFGPDGKLYGCQPAKRRIVAWDESGQESTFEEGIEAHTLVATADGNVFAQVQRERLELGVNIDDKDYIYFIQPDKPTKKLEVKLNSRLSLPGLLVLWPDGGSLVMCATSRGLLHHLYVFRIDKDINLSHPERYYGIRQMDEDPAASKSDVALFAAFAHGQATMDTASRLYYSSPLGIQIFDPTGRLCGVLLKPGDAPITALTFGGPDRDHLFIACGDKIYSRKTKAKGAFPLEPKKK